MSNWNKKAGLKEIADAMDALKKAEEEVSKLHESIGGSSEKIKSITMCNKMGNVMASISSYKTYNQRSYRRSLEEYCKVARNHAKELLEESKKIHEQNLPKLEINKTIRKAVEGMMDSIGIGVTFSTWAYKTSRSRKRTETRNIAGWKRDLDRCVVIDDGYSTAENQYKIFLEKVDSHEKSERIRIDKEKKEKEQELLKQKEVTEAITFLTNKGLSAPTDYTIETAVEIHKNMTMSAQDYVNKYGAEILWEDDSRFSVLDEQITGEWRWGVEKEATIKDSFTGKTYSVGFRTQPEHSLKDTNF